MKALSHVLSLGRGHIRAFLLVAVLASLGTGATLLEPWIYRAIIDDIAGVFVSPETPARAHTMAGDLRRSVRHLPSSGQRLFQQPLQKVGDESERREIQPRTLHQAFATVLLGALILLGARSISEVCRLIGDNKAAALSNRLEAGFIHRIFGHVLRLPLSFFSRRASGAVARQIDQSDQISPVFTALAQEIWPDLFGLLAILAIMLSVNAELSLVALIALPIYGLVTWRMTRKLDTRLEEYYALWDQVSSRIQQAVAGIKTVQAHGNVLHESRALEEEMGKAYAAYLDRNRLQNRFTFVQEILIAASKAGVLIFGGLKALEHQLTPGDVVLFLAYLDRTYLPIQNLTGLYTSLQQNVASLRRAEKLLDVSEASGEALPRLKVDGGAVTFERVRFGYEPDRPVLNDVSFRIEAGERVALIGPSGAGKTTITDLLSGLYRPNSGSIRIDGQSLEAVAPSSIRERVRGVAVDGMLFRMTIEENIRYGNLSASEVEIAEAAERAGLSGVLARLPEGLRTPIGERGVELSVGERQRVLLARALVARPPVLILDEPTANLDFQTEMSIKQALNELARDRTTLIVAHRRSMLTDVDRILVLRAGRIEQDGTPGKLLLREGYFRDMLLADEAAAG
jgi:ATP-binding cassette subfamily B protein